MEEKLIIVKTLSQLADLEEYLRDKEYIAYDTETTGVLKSSEIIGFSVCAEETVGYYVMVSYWDVAAQCLVYTEVAPAIALFLVNLAEKSLIMQNAPFDCAMTLNNYGLDLMPYVHTDTMILGHLLDENRHNGLKELGAAFFGEDARKEQAEMKASVAANGGLLTKETYELYKADGDLIARYGAKDAILTLKIFGELVPKLYEEGLDKFFYEEESMPLLRGPTYDLNCTGMKIDGDALQVLKNTLQAECMELKAFIYNEVTPHVKAKYPATGKTNVFNIGSTTQLSWLLFVQLENEFGTLTKEGKNLCKALEIKVPYTIGAKRQFIDLLKSYKDRIYTQAEYNPKTKKMGRPKKVRDYWMYLSCGKESITKASQRYKWAGKLLEYKKSLKLLNTYVEGIQDKVQYGIIHPSFLQHGTTSGRYSSRKPNFQNLPRDDKRVKACIVARPGNVFVGADYAQLEPRVFASISQDKTLMACFANGEDFYSVVGAPVFDKTDCTLIKSDKDSFAKKYPKLRDDAKIFSLATPYGRTAMQQSLSMGRSIEECQTLIDRYFAAYPKVELMMLESHEQAKANGVVYSLFGRPRRIPEAKKIKKLYGNSTHSELPYVARTLLNLGMNHRVQSTAASIMNRAAIEVHRTIQELSKHDPRWLQVKIVLQVHDELILEGPKELAEDMAAVLKSGMEDTVSLPGVALVAEPKIAINLADLK